MSAAVHNPVVAEAATSTFDQIKEGALKAVNWMGKQIQWLGSTIKEYAIKVFEFAKPFFQNIGKMLAETYDKIREFVIANKEVSIAVGVAIPVIAALALGAYFLCSDSSAKEAKGDTKKIFA